MYRLDGVEPEVRSYFEPVARMVLASRDPQDALEVRAAGGWVCAQRVAGRGSSGGAPAAPAVRGALLPPELPSLTPTALPSPSADSARWPR
jgi:hypothetical protein